MQPTPTDDEIRGNPAFPLVAASYRVNNRIFWGGLPVFLAVAIYSTAGHARAYAICFVLAALGYGAQMIVFWRVRPALSQISSSPEVQNRARRLASEAATSRFGRWLAPWFPSARVSRSSNDQGTRPDGSDHTAE